MNAFFKILKTSSAIRKSNHFSFWIAETSSKRIKIASAITKCTKLLFDIVNAFFKILKTSSAIRKSNHFSFWIAETSSKRIKIASAITKWSFVSGCENLHAWTRPVIRDNNEDFFLKTYLHFLMTLKRVNSVMILHIHKINFLREMSLNLIKIALIWNRNLFYICYKMSRS